MLYCKNVRDFGRVYVYGCLLFKQLPEPSFCHECSGADSYLPKFSYSLTLLYNQRLTSKKKSNNYSYNNIFSYNTNRATVLLREPVRVCWYVPSCCCVDDTVRVRARLGYAYPCDLASVQAWRYRVHLFLQYGLCT